MWSRLDVLFWDSSAKNASRQSHVWHKTRRWREKAGCFRRFFSLRSYKTYPNSERRSDLGSTGLNRWRHSSTRRRHSSTRLQMFPRKNRTGSLLALFEVRLDHPCPRLPPFCPQIRRVRPSNCDFARSRTGGGLVPAFPDLEARLTRNPCGKMRELLSL